MIHLARPEISADAVRADIEAILASGTLTNGPYRDRFEQLIAERAGSAHALATTSATTALHLTLATAGIGPGDAVLVADFTFPASVNVVIQTGATPVLVDIDLDTFTIDIDDAESKITPACKAIMPVDTFGAPARLSELRALAAAHGLLLVEDAACSLGATYDGRPAGSFGVGCFSFHPRKSITTGEGGALTSDDAGFADRARMLRSHGGASGEFYQHFVAPGFNYRMSEIQAALGIAGIARLDEILAGRRAAAARYDAALEHLPVQTPAAHANATHTYQTYAVLLGEGIDRDDVIRRMRARDVETTLGTYAVHAEPYMEALGYRPGELAQSYAAYKRTLALPLWSQITPDEQDQVVEALRDALKEASS